MTRRNINFYISSHIESLSDQWIANTHYHKDVFLPHVILTQTQGMNNWLKMQRVRALGNSTNLQFVTPNDFLLMVYELIQVHTAQKVSTRNIDFIIYKILSEKEFQNRFPDVARYFRSDNNNLRELRQWELAHQAADLLDQYQIYRQDILRRWLNLKEEDTRFRWQQYIWQKLHSTLGDRLIDLSRMQTEVFSLLKEKKNKEKISSRFPHVSLFGISVLSPYHIQMLYKLSEIIRVDFYLSNPAPDIFWDMDISESEMLRKGIKEEYAVGNELLVNWGKVIQHTFRLLYQDDLAINTSHILEDREPKDDSLLSRLKMSIRQNNTEKGYWPSGLITDGSISVANHYTIQNEVIGLYNYIIGLTQESRDIEDSDILIICTDINEYAPYIRSVFDTAASALKYTIADESARAGDNIISSLIDILKFDAGRFTSEDIFKLLEHKPIRDRFSITRIKYLKSIIQQLNIRYGVYNSSADDTYLVSWWHGMKKSVLNIFLDEVSEYKMDDKNFAVKSMIDQNNDILELNNLFEFADQLIAFSGKTQRPQTLSQWKSIIDGAIQTFISEETDHFIEQYESVVQQMKQLEMIDELIGHEEISFQVFRHRLAANLSHISTENRFMRRGITFCSPVPFRSVPFKIIGFLGMNADAFPRRQDESDINYITRHPQLGDRNIKENDKHLFLESLLAAGDRFYISYLGKNTKDNSTLPPSILVDELIDYIQSQSDHAEDIRQIIIKEYPLNHYSYKYNKPGSHLPPNYLIRKNPEYPAIFKKETAVDEGMLNIELKDLINYFANPARYYFTKYRNIYLEQNEGTRDEYEKLFLSHLDNIILKNDFIRYPDDDLLKAYQHHYLNGALPLKKVGEHYLSSWISDIQDMRLRMNPYINPDRKCSHHIDLQLPGIRISAQIDMYGHHLLGYTMSRNIMTAKLALFLNYIFLRSQDIETTPVLVTSEGEYNIKEISPENAHKEIENLVGFFSKNHRKAIPVDSHVNTSLMQNAMEYNIKRILSGMYQRSFNTYIKTILDNYDIREVYQETMYITEHIYAYINNHFVTSENQKK